MRTMKLLSRFSLLTICIGLIVIHLSCTDNPVGAGGPAYNFKFKVRVNDANGHPVMGIRVSIWNLLSFRLFPALDGREPMLENKSVYGSTAFALDAPVQFRGNLEILDLDNRLLASLLSPHTYGPGSYSAIWQSGADAPTGVYKCRFIAKSDTTGTTLFQDSLYMALYQFDPELTVLGWTSLNGTVETKRGVLFPNLYHVPDLIETKDSPEPLRSFHFTDTVRIVLTDTTTGHQIPYDRVLANGPNDYTFVWNPGSADQRMSFRNDDALLRPFPNPIVRRDTDIPTHWKLGQNYPNPFN